MTRGVTVTLGLAGRNLLLVRRMPSVFIPSLVMPLFSLPLLLVGEVVRTPEWWAARFNVILVAVAAALMLFLLRDRGDLRQLRRVLLILLFASFLTNRLRDYNAEIFTAALVAIGLVLVTTGRRALLGWAAIVVGVVNTPAALVGAALVAGAEALRTRRFRYLLVPVAAAVLIMTEAWVRRGIPPAPAQWLGSRARRRRHHPA